MVSQIPVADRSGLLRTQRDHDNHLVRDQPADTGRKLSQAFDGPPHASSFTSSGSPSRTRSTTLRISLASTTTLRVTRSGPSTRVRRAHLRRRPRTPLAPSSLTRSLRPRSRLHPLPHPRPDICTRTERGQRHPLGFPGRARGVLCRAECVATPFGPFPSADQVPSHDRKRLHSVVQAHRPVVPLRLVGRPHRDAHLPRCAARRQGAHSAGRGAPGRDGRDHSHVTDALMNSRVGTGRHTS